MPVHRAAEHPGALATPSTIIARITIAGIITPRSIDRRRYTSIASLIGKRYEWELPGTPSGRRIWPVTRMSFPIRL
jgi:hypothetical protein